MLLISISLLLFCFSSQSLPYWTWIYLFLNLLIEQTVNASFWLHYPMELPEVPAIAFSLRPSSQKHYLGLNMLYSGWVSFADFNNKQLQICSRFVCFSEFCITNYLLITKYKTIFNPFSHDFLLQHIFVWSNFFLLKLSFSLICIL